MAYILEWKLPTRCAGGLAAAFLFTGCGAGGSEQVDSLNGEGSAEPVTGRPDSAAADDAPTSDLEAPPKPEASTPVDPSASLPPVQASNGSSEGTPGVPVPAEPVPATSATPENVAEQCPDDAFYCNGNCLSELGETVGACRLVYLSDSPFSVLDAAPLQQHEGGLLLAHDDQIVWLDTVDLQTETLVDGFDSVHHLQVVDDLLYISGTRAGVSDVWSVPADGGDLSSLGLQGPEPERVQWFEIYRSILYHEVRTGRDSEMRRLDMETGAVDSVGPYVNPPLQFHGDYAYYYDLDLVRVPLATMSDLFTIAPVVTYDSLEGPPAVFFPTESALYWFTSASSATPPPPLRFWRLQNGASERELLWEFAPGTAQGAYRTLSARYALASADWHGDSVHDLWLVPLTGGEPSKAAEVGPPPGWPIGSSAVLTDTHVYYARQRHGSASVRSAILEIALPEGG